MNLKLLKKAVKESGLSQAEISRRCKISKCEISRILSGDRENVTCDSANRIIVGLGIDNQLATMIFFDKKKY